MINKVDRPDARWEEVVDEVLDLFIELQAEDHQLESPFLYASAARASPRWSRRSPTTMRTSRPCWTRF